MVVWEDVRDSTGQPILQCSWSPLFIIAHNLVIALPAEPLKEAC
jgi:hypothetical protein